MWTGVGGRTRPTIGALVPATPHPPQTMTSAGERAVAEKEIGGSPRHMRDIVLGVVRDGTVHAIDAPEIDALERGDRLLCVRRAGPDE